MTPDDKTRATAEACDYVAPFAVDEDDVTDCDVFDAGGPVNGAYVCTANTREMADEIVRALNERWERLGL